MFSRVVMGTRISFQVAGEVLLIAGTISILLGVIAGYRGGMVDEVIMRAADILLAFPSFLLAMGLDDLSRAKLHCHLLVDPDLPRPGDCHHCGRLYVPG